MLSMTANSRVIWSLLSSFTIRRLGEVPGLIKLRMFAFHFCGICNRSKEPGLIRLRMLAFHGPCHVSQGFEVAQSLPGPLLPEPRQSARLTFFASASKGRRNPCSGSWISRPLANHLRAAPRIHPGLLRWGKAGKTSARITPYTLRRRHGRKRIIQDNDTKYVIERRNDGIRGTTIGTVKCVRSLMLRHLIMAPEYPEVCRALSGSSEGSWHGSPA
jgi:hypothetical protein